MLHIYNTLTKIKTPFKPIIDGKVTMYVCGMTVYDYCHIGHARTMTVFDIVYRYLTYLKYEVKYIRNITDIDDKIIQRAQKNQENYQLLTQRFIEAMQQDARALNILTPSMEPRATDYIFSIISLIEKLMKKELAYTASNGDVYYAVQRFERYGELAHQNMEKLLAGSRVSIIDAKHNPLDFVLWKLEKPGEPSWDSPWGKGRPGWHIECSAMCGECLALPIDIHGGGLDLVFPHHQNEVAQSEGAEDKILAQIWMHAGFVTVHKEKMSKSLNNFFTIREVLAQYAPEVVRYFMLTSHYRSGLNYAVELLEQARASLERLYLVLREAPAEIKKDSVTPENIFTQRFHAAMEDDFNTPEALAVLFDLAREINKTGNLQLMVTLKSLGNLLGLLTDTPEDFFQRIPQTLISAEEIEHLIEMRRQARNQKDWVKADNIRKLLVQKGIVIEDNSSVTRWRRLTVQDAQLQ